MHISPATLYCPNPHCQTPNPESHQVCQQCHTPLPKRYLWVVGTDLTPGALLADRYQVKGERVVLDTQPGQPPRAAVEIPSAVAPYLKLFPYRLHLPQVYEVIPSAAGNPSLLLLEEAPLSSLELKPSSTGQARAEPLEQAWAGATAIRQLGWLWQMAQLWQPLGSQGAASSLLNPHLLRVEGPLVRLLELQLDQGKQPTLSQLGQLWLQWLPQAQVTITPSLEQLCQQLLDQQIQSPEMLVAQLDHWLMLASKSQRYQVQLATQTDQGPTRKRNEDACYPPSGTFSTGTTETCVIVCDGVGGHAGGDVASTIAIAACKQHLEGLSLETLTPNQVMDELETAAYIANDLISDQNDQEQRHDRQRMGTTLVLALVRGPELYIAHVGDSRAYWITPGGCYQVTVDDDVASRDVRLGYALYREALRQPVSGSLVQALGMGPSAILRPTVQRFFVDGDCIFLLCSDGLSDYDRVEESWQSEILPVLKGDRDLQDLSQGLVDLANHQNGHDNVTLGLLYYQISDADQSIPLSTELLRAESSPSPSTGAPTRRLQQPRRSLLLPLVVATLLVLVVAGALAYWLLPVLSRRLVYQPQPAPSPLPPTPVQPTAVIQAGTFLRVGPEAIEQASGPDLRGNSRPLVLSAQPGPSQTSIGRLLPSSVLQVMARQTLPEQGSWLQVRICSAPQGAFPNPAASPTAPATAPATPRPPLQTGATGWILETQLAIATEPREPGELGPIQRSACLPNPSPAPLPPDSLQSQ